MGKTFQQSAITGAVNVSLRCNLRTPSVRAILQVVPGSCIGSDGISTGNRIAIDNEIENICNSGGLPTISLGVNVGRTSTRCGNLPCNVSRMATSFSTCISLVHRRPSCLGLGVFRFGKTRARILTSTGMSSLLSSPLVAFRAGSAISLSTLTGAFPLRRDIAVAKGLSTSVKVGYHLSTLGGRSVKHVGLKNGLRLGSFRLGSATGSFSFLNGTAFHFHSGRALRTRVSIHGLILEDHFLSSSVRQLITGISSAGPRSAGHVISLRYSVRIDGLHTSVNSSVGLCDTHTGTRTTLKPRRISMAGPTVSFSLHTSSLFFDTTKAHVTVGITNVGVGTSGLGSSL